jgi:hypothetical protein
MSYFLGSSEMSVDVTTSKNPKFESRNPCLRRSGFAQAGKKSSKLKFQNSKLFFVSEIGILNIRACFEFRLPTAGRCFEFIVS